ncbi:MAG: hypothetical protein KF849_00830 [Rhizobiaceae bacterium]|nr:hypothetical protein [Rhizobiaceae bacterium]
MVEAPGSPQAQNSGIAPIFTYFGQFIDHDITAGTDRDSAVSTISPDDLAPLARLRVEAGVKNLRTGALELDSLYGDAAISDGFARKLIEAMREPGAHAKMRVDLFSPSQIGSVPLPRDGKGDLLRLGRLLVEGQVSAEELRALPPDLRASFLDSKGTPRIHKAIIGDSRNDENLVVAQLHLALLRLHNGLVDACDDAEALGRGDDAVHAWARQRVTWLYQWLVVNEFLPAICDSATLRSVIAREAPLYAGLLARHSPKPGGRLPLPVEFSAAAFRYGHSMVRAEYDWNRFFGRSVGGTPNILERARFEHLFAFTGSAAVPMPETATASFDRLPAHWGAEWERLIPAQSAHSDRFARAIDCELAPPLRDMNNEPTDHGGLFRMLARRNLRRGHRLNIPAAQDCIAQIYLLSDLVIEPLTGSELRSGRTADAVEAGGFDRSTPLWFYVLKEAEVRAGGNALGPLGTVLVAETLLGLIIADPQSYWHQPGTDRGRWCPNDTVRPGGAPVNSMRRMLEAAQLL